MTVKTTLSFTDRHRAYLAEKVAEGVYASTSAAVAAAVEQMMRDEATRDRALDAMAEEIRARMATPRAAYLPADEVLDGLRAVRGSRPGE
ncbi:hypothetical protein [Tropicimonas sp. IMCC34043]|uniref:hypothetical protein n=1 Tax=Tropicimonas sp. IMCC34043 TaxID=2248760 RepID=UPI000E286DB0|nr:hypothetical protein [Tropicimonas sp. IMCC34043]